MPENDQRFLLTMDLAGIGTDIIEIARIKKAAERNGERFLMKVFTATERSFCEARQDRFACYAARFAAKEAVLKAMGTGLAGARWTDVEISRVGGDGPMVMLHGATAALAAEKGIAKILLSLSHDRSRALAFAVAVREEA
ncbi:MAG: Holo-(acyl-carrier-protein) synthase [Pelotomaculum sp. PtaB.Bin104]|nr:MAG: Holo-(acyl-carrier-protein) synthase [Pelotomaculum sp. PtaB.Bin104]